MKSFVLFFIFIFENIDNGNDKYVRPNTHKDIKKFRWKDVPLNVYDSGLTTVVLITSTADAI